MFNSYLYDYLFSEIFHHVRLFHAVRLLDTLEYGICEAFGIIIIVIMDEAMREFESLLSVTQKKFWQMPKTTTTTQIGQSGKKTIEIPS